VSLGPCGSTPMATAMSWISVLANRRSRSTSQVLSTLPRSGRMAWHSLSRPILALPPAESPSTRKTSLCARSLLSQSVSLPGSTATPEPLRFSTFWPAFWRDCAGLDGQFGQLLAVVDVLVEPQLQRRPHEAGDQPHRVARIQALLDLALELRVEHLGRQHVRGAGEHVFGQQLHALGQQRVQLDEALDRVEQAVAQAALVRAAGAGGDQVDVALAHRRAVFGEGHAPGAPSPSAKFSLLLGEALALEQRDDRVAVSVCIR
jgi:hypothetical protein